MMQDRKALQAGTSHFLGQNFSKAQEIKFQDQNGQEVYAWTTSWGVSTRLVGALIMAHSDDDGLVLPPRLAPTHCVILPIYRDDAQRAEVLAYCQSLKQELSALRYEQEPIRVEIDDRDLRGGEKKWFHVKRGVPIRLEIGPKDMAAGAVFMGRRDTGEQVGMPRAQFLSDVPALLASIQSQLLQRARELRDSNTVTIDNETDFRSFFGSESEESTKIHGGFALCHFASEAAVAPLLQELKVTIRCVPIAMESSPAAASTPVKTHPSERSLLKPIKPDVFPREPGGPTSLSAATR